MPHFGNGRSPHGIIHTFDEDLKDVNGSYDKKLLDNKVNGTKGELERQFQKETTQEMINNLIDFIPKCHLKREFYSNNSDGSNEEINNLINHSPADIENRSGVFYMNPCISQTLYTINKLKEEFPDLEEHINLGIEFFEFENGIKSAHAFIEINVPNGNKMIIDYARSNDVYIYQGDYNNNSKGIKPGSHELIRIKSNLFNKSDNIFEIAKEAGFDEESILGIKNNLSILLKHLCDENNGNSEYTGKEKYKKWEKEHGNSPIFCLENGKNEKGDTEWVEFKIENGDSKRFFVENGKNEDGSIIWSELHLGNLNPLRIYIEDNMGNKQYIQDKLEKNIQNFIGYTLYCK